MGSPLGPRKELEEFARKRRVCHLLYFHRYFRLTIEESDLPESSITHLAQLFDQPDRFSDQLRALTDQGKHTLALTQLLSRDGLLPSTKQESMIAVLCDFAEDYLESPHPSHHVSVENGALQLINLQLPPDLTSTERLTLLAAGIQKSKAVCFPAKIAKDEDLLEHQFATSSSFEKRKLGPHINRVEVEKLNILVAERAETALATGRIRFDRNWLEFWKWYSDFLPTRSLQKSEILLSDPTAVALFVRIIINEQLEENYPQCPPDLARIALHKVEHCFGFENFENALNLHQQHIEEVLENYDCLLKIFNSIREEALKA